MPITLFTSLSVAASTFGILGHMRVVRQVQPMQLLWFYPGLLQAMLPLLSTRPHQSDLYTGAGCSTHIGGSVPDQSSKPSWGECFISKESVKTTAGFGDRNMLGRL